MRGLRVEVPVRLTTTDRDILWSARADAPVVPSLGVLQFSTGFGRTADLAISHMTGQLDPNWLNFLGGLSSVLELPWA